MGKHLKYPTRCSSCGATLKYPISKAKAQKRPYRYAHAGHGLCEACFAACKRAGADPATFKHQPKRITRHRFPCPCVKCGREMTYPHDGTWPGRGLAHAGRGLCVICYYYEWNEKRKAARRAAKHQGKSGV